MQKNFKITLGTTDFKKVIPNFAFPRPIYPQFAKKKSFKAAQNQEQASEQASQVNQVNQAKQEKQTIKANQYKANQACNVS